MVDAGRRELINSRSNRSCFRGAEVSHRTVRDSRSHGEVTLAFRGSERNESTA